MKKLKIAFYWCASCGGCEEAVIDINEEIIKLGETVEIVFWPAAMDFKYADLEKLTSGEIAACFINGSIRSEENLKIVQTLREKSALIIAFGSCAHIGGIPGLANLFSKEEIFETVYNKQLTVYNPGKILPKKKYKTDYGNLKLPDIHDVLLPLDQVIHVDYYLPGCAPPSDIVINAVNSILEDKLPDKGKVLASEKSLCHYCSRKDSRPEKLLLKEIKRVHEILIEEDKCFLGQGLLCFGPVTRGGCGERCISVNMPCRGCFGSPDNVLDSGGKFLSAFAPMIDYADENELEIFADSLIDMVGSFYRFSLPSSALKNKKGDEV